MKSGARKEIHLRGTVMRFMKTPPPVPAMFQTVGDIENEIQGEEDGDHLNIEGPIPQNTKAGGGEIAVSGLRNCYSKSSVDKNPHEKMNRNVKDVRPETRPENSLLWPQGENAFGEEEKRGESGEKEQHSTQPILQRLEEKIKSQPVICNQMVTYLGDGSHSGLALLSKLAPCILVFRIKERIDVGHNLQHQGLSELSFGHLRLPFFDFALHHFGVDGVADS